MQEMQGTQVQSLGREDPRREWQPTSVFLPGEFHGQRSLVGYSSWDHKESDTTVYPRTEALLALGGRSDCRGHIRISILWQVPRTVHPQHIWSWISAALNWHEHGWGKTLLPFRSETKRGWWCKHFLKGGGQRCPPKCKSGGVGSQNYWSWESKPT